MIEENIVLPTGVPSGCEEVPLWAIVAGREHWDIVETPWATLHSSVITVRGHSLVYRQSQVQELPDAEARADLDALLAKWRIQGKCDLVLRFADERVRDLLSHYSEGGDREKRVPLTACRFYRKRRTCRRG